RRGSRHAARLDLPDRLPGGAGGADECAQARTGQPGPPHAARRRGSGPGGGRDQPTLGGPARRTGAGGRPRAPRPHRTGRAGRRRAAPRLGGRRRAPSRGAATVAAMSEVGVRLVDDAPMVRTALTMIRGSDERIIVVGQAEDGREGLSLIAEQRPDVVLMDIRMPRLDGLAATEELARSGSPSKVIVLTTFDADDDVMRALRHGADGFLLKDTEPERIVEAVRLVAAGSSILSPGITGRVLDQVRSARSAGQATTRRDAR